MKSDISEFSYGFALTSELMHTYKLFPIGAPFFINQYKEGKAGGGYDMKLPGVPVFFQFKVSETLTTNNSSNSAILGLPYYRFGIRSRKISTQHDLLLDLESTGNEVYYAAPMFRYPSELDYHFSTLSIVDNSAFVTPRAIGVIADDNPHSISFNKKDSFAIFRSDPKRIELAKIDIDLPRIRKRDEGEGNRNTQDLINELVNLYRERDVSISGTRERFLRQGLENRSGLEHVSYLARNLYGLEVLYV